MPTIQEITESVIRENITRAMGDVAQTMLGQTITFKAAVSALPEEGCWPPIAVRANETPLPQVVGMVGFIGDINGLIYLYFPLPYARAASCQLLGMSEAEVEEAGDSVINDAIGELTNMSVGGFKNRLCDAGYPCKLTIPSILRGSNFCIEPIIEAARYIYHFEGEGHKIVTDILIKNAD